MKGVLQQLIQRVGDAMIRIGAEGDPLVRVSQDEQFGDYQSNAAMGIAKKLGKKPRDVAAAIIENLDVSEISEPPEIAGPGFINFRLKPSYLAQFLERVPSISEPPVGGGEPGKPGLPGGDRLGIERAANPQVVVVDLSSPNLAKEMHVGHLRSTVIGDCVCRILEFQGHTVHRENHVGDWGTQFGMLVAHLRRVRPEVIDNPASLVIQDLESFYIEAKARFDADDEFKKEARETVVALQAGDQADPTCRAVRAIWQAFCKESLRHCHAIYDRLGVKLVDRGESFYTELMDEVIARLERMRAERGDGFVAVSEGALCIFMEGYKTREGEPFPLMVRKSDGGHNYATSDLATILHRVEHLKAKRIVYVVGISQKQHFEMVFAAARQAGWVPGDVTLEHLGFGNVLSGTGKPFKTREGGTVKLADILDEAVARARRVVESPSEPRTSVRADIRDDEHHVERETARTEAGGSVTDGTHGRSFTPEQTDKIAETVGLASVKYFDLSHGLTSDYRFDVDTMLSLEGNTAPYMLYAYARIRSIGRKAGVDFATLGPATPLVLEHPAEIALAKKLCQFVNTLESAGAELRPNLLTDYLYDLAKVFSRFYDKKLGVRVIDAAPESLRLSRLRLCDLTARTLHLGLSFLGIETVEQM